MSHHYLTEVQLNNSGTLFCCTSHCATPTEY